MSSSLLDKNVLSKQINRDLLLFDKYKSEEHFEAEEDKKGESVSFSYGKCSICADRATGIHYGIASCEACKGFFKRTMLRKDKYRCFFGAQCPITAENKNKCKACRFNRCLQAGMSIEGARFGRLPKSLKETIQSNSSEMAIHKTIDKSHSTNENSSQLMRKSFNDFDLARMNDLFECSKIKIRRLHSSFNLASNRYESANPDSITELNFNLNISFLCDKIYQTHVDTNQFVEQCLDRALTRIKNKHVVLHSDGHDASMNEVWAGLIEGIKLSIKNFIRFAKQLPGFGQLSSNDFQTIVDSRLFEFYMLKHASLFIDGESFVMLINGIQYTRSWLKRIVSDEMTRAMFDFTEHLNSLRMTSKEIALLIAFVLTLLPEDSRLEEPAKLSDLHVFYERAVLHEFDLNLRTDQFVKEWKKLIVEMTELNKLNIKCIRSLVPLNSFE